MSKYYRYALVMMMVLTLIMGVIGAQDDEYKVLVDAEAVGSSDVPTLDPSLAIDSSSIAVIESITVGLTRLNEITVEPEPGMATWEVSEDGMTYTFFIMEGVPWVYYDADAGEVVEVPDNDGNVRYVTAHDFAYNIRRTLDPRTGAAYAGVLAPWIVGGSESIDITVSASEEFDDAVVDEVVAALGVEVVDDYTLVLTSPEPAAFLPQMYGLWMTVAAPQWLIEDLGTLWTEPEYIQSYGPFAVKEWVHDESLTLIANPLWPGTEYVPSPALDEVVFLVRQARTALAEFEAGKVHVAPVPIADIDRIRATPELEELHYVGSSKYTYYYGFNVEKPPTDNVHIRRALSLAIDRVDIVENVVKGGQAPAGFFTRPDILAGPAQEDYPGTGSFFDVDLALEELAMGLEELGLSDVSELPPIMLMHNTSEVHATVAQAIQNMWVENLGLQVDIASQDWIIFLDLCRTDAPQIFRLVWGWDYPDANSFLYDVFHSTSSSNYTNWTSETFDALVEEAALSPDTATRTDLYAQAEHILTWEDAAIAPIYYYVAHRMTQANVIRTYSVLGYERYEKWDLQD